jgi:hypothetical protein
LLLALDEEPEEFDRVREALIGRLLPATNLRRPSWTTWWTFTGALGAWVRAEAGAQAKKRREQTTRCRLSGELPQARPRNAG